MKGEEKRRTVEAAQMGMATANQVRRDLELRVLLLEGGEEAGNEVAGTSAAPRVVTEADDELLELPHATNRHGRGAGETGEHTRDEIGRTSNGEEEGNKLSHKP